jgi:hypothetical protein
MPNWKKAYHANYWGPLGSDGRGNRDAPGGFLPQGLLLQHRVADNLCLPIIDWMSSFGCVQESMILMGLEYCEQLIARGVIIILAVTVARSRRYCLWREN